jgi:hypothetical protein
MTRRLKIIEDIFPNLHSDGYMSYSRVDACYNCIAYAVGDTRRFWDGWGNDPGMFWPSTPGNSLCHLIEALLADGFEKCNDASQEPGYEKIAIYENANGWSHAARLRDDGWWESKIGQAEDILHKTLQGLEGNFYGKVSGFMKRTIKERVKRRLSRPR